MRQGRGGKEGVVVRDESGSPLVSDWSGSVGFAGVGRSRHQSIELEDVLAASGHSLGILYPLLSLMLLGTWPSAFHRAKPCRPPS